MLLLRGGRVCASTSVTGFGNFVSQGSLRGQLPEDKRELRVLSVGLFDGIGALRVALDLLEVDVQGHVAVEQSAEATRVVEAAFPGVIKVQDIALVDSAMVQGWALKFSQVAVVVLGAGPPCQGVSGLNASRKGALCDPRSVLYKHVKRAFSVVSSAYSHGKRSFYGRAGLQGNEWGLWGYTMALRFGPDDLVQ